MKGLKPPKAASIIRKNAFLASNGVSIMNASVMWYGGAKKGKTRTIISAFSGVDYMFLDFDRNYESTINEIKKTGASYYNGYAAEDVLVQLMKGRITEAVVVIDSLVHAIAILARYYLISPAGKKDDEFKRLKPYIGVSHEATSMFFNKFIYPMLESNSINFIHHTTQNMMGEKMEGNQGSWLSVFDFTYKLDGDKFILQAGRLPCAPTTVGKENLYDRLKKCISDNNENIEVSGEEMNVTAKATVTNNKALRTVLDELISKGEGIEVKKGNKKYVFYKDST